MKKIFKVSFILPIILNQSFIDINSDINAKIFIYTILVIYSCRGSSYALVISICGFLT